MNDLFTKTLLADMPHQNFRDKLAIYEPLIGNWEFEWKGEAYGREMTVPGEWLFSWVLEGRAIQDNWICPKTALRGSGEYPEGEYGTTIRMYDFKDEQLKAFWLGPAMSQINVFKAKVEDGMIVQEEIMTAPGAMLAKWIFRDISETAFTWQAYASEDGAKTWSMVSEVAARR